MDIKQFKQFLKNTSATKPLSEAVEIVDKSDRKGINGADAHVTPENSAAIDRALWLPTKNDRAVWSSSELKKVYRFYVNDNPSSGGTGLVRVDLAAGTIQFLNQKKYEQSGEKLSSSVWERPYKIKRFTVFNKDVLKNQ